MIAGFIILRLRGILGKRTGFEGKAPSQFEKVLNDIQSEKKPSQRKILMIKHKKNLLMELKLLTKQL